MPSNGYQAQLANNMEKLNLDYWGKTNGKMHFAFEGWKPWEQQQCTMENG